jgi:hypothetical protein
VTPARRRGGLVVSLAMAAACGGDDGGDGGGGAIDGGSDPADARPMADADPGPDATPAALDCAGAGLPATAADPVQVSGQTVTLQLATLSPVAGVSLTAFEVGEAAAIAGPVTSAADGTFALTAATGGQPLDAYVLAKRDGHLDTYLFPPTAVTRDLAGGTVPVLTANHVDTMAGFAQQMIDPGKGHLIVALLDCDGALVEGARVTTAPAGDLVYLSDSGVPVAGRTTTSTQGVAVVFNLPPGPVTVDARRGGVDLRTNGVEVHADSLTATLLVP